MIGFMSYIYKSNKNGIYKLIIFLYEKYINKSINIFKVMILFKKKIDFEIFPII